MSTAPSTTAPSSPSSSNGNSGKGPEDRKLTSQSSSSDLNKSDAALERLNDDQRKALELFRRRLAESHPDHTATDFTYCRFLRARKFDVDLAHTMYANYLKWRKDNDVDGVLTNPPTEIRTVLAKFVPEAFHKFDKLGMPAYFLKLGKIRSAELLQVLTLDEFVRAHIWGMEYSFQRAEESSRRLGRNIDCFVNVVDMTGLSASHRIGLKYVKYVAGLDSNYYPEALGKNFIINAPWIFHNVLWKIVAPWMDPVTRAKMVVVGGDYKEALLQRFDADALPKEYGGTCECSAPYPCCREYTDAEIEEVMVECEKKLNLASVDVDSGKVIEYKFDTKSATGATFAYVVKTVKWDIGFEAKFYPAAGRGEGKTKEVVWHAMERISQPMRGSFSSDGPGTAVFTFSNYHSWMTPKTVKYKVHVSENIVEEGGEGKSEGKEEKSSSS